MCNSFHCRPRGNRCPHAVVDYVKVDHFITNLICVLCGEKLGWYEDHTKAPDTYITGKPRKLTLEEKRNLV